MQVKYDTSYNRSLKRFQKKDKQLIPIIENTIDLLLADKNDERLKFKKMNCKKDKNRYSIRVLNEAYRILLTVFDDEYRLVCVCNHNKYDTYNKNC